MSAARDVIIEPTSFEVVDFDAERIARLVSEVASKVDLPESLSIRVVIDEQSMLSQARLTSVAPVVIETAGGAFEDRSRPRRLSEANTIDELARLLQRVADRRNAAFAGAPAEEELSPQQRVAWGVSALGRTARWQATTFEARHRYDFSLCCGFGPAAQEAFEMLWRLERPTWEIIAGVAFPPVPAAGGPRARGYG